MTDSNGLAHSAGQATGSIPGETEAAVGARPLKAPSRRWTADEDAYVTHWYSSVGIPASLLCLDLNRTEPAVTHRIYKLGLKQPPGGMAVGNRRRKATTASAVGTKPKAE